MRLLRRGKEPSGSDELRERLTPEQYRVTQKSGTERPFTGKYWDSKDAGTYHCVVCDEPLFSSEAKYDSGTGWPSFTAALSNGGADADKVARKVDRSLLMRRVEALCASCGAHLGHIFPDGPSETGERFCMNSASLNLAPPDSGK